MSEVEATGRRPRSTWLDAARGAAVLAMVAYHSAWDLSQLRLIETDILASASWNLFARAIAASFLVIVGVGLALAQANAFRPRAFWTRLGRVGLAAAAVTVATVFAFPRSYIFFGILHNIVVSSVIALPFLHAPWLVTGLAALLVLAAPALVSHPAFDAPGLVFLGLGERAPLTNDFVPIFPWTGFVLLGLAAARSIGRLRADPQAARPGWSLRALTRLGRHSLAIYLLHQPVIFGALWGFAALTGPNPAAVAAPFLRQCRASCEAAGQAATLCQASCACTMERFRSAGLWQGAVEGRPNADQLGRMSDLARLCYDDASAAAPKPR